MGKKLKFLKKSYIKEKSLKGLFRLFSLGNIFSKKNEEKKEKRTVLISSLDALGDSVIKMESIRRIIDYFGNENVYVLCKKQWEFLFKGLGVKVFVDDVQGNILRSALLYVDINKINYTDIVFFELGGDSISEELIYRKGKKIYGVSEMKKAIKEETQNRKEHILEVPQKIIEELTGKTYQLEELRGDSNTFSHIKDDNKIEYNGKYITFGIGAASVKRMLPIERASDILSYLTAKFPNTKIYLLGTGKRQNKYAKELMNTLKKEEKENIISLVYKTTAKESFFLIKNSDVFIGYDSGLGNIAFVLNKNLVSLQWRDNWMWDHGDFSNVASVIGDGINPVNDGIHGNDRLNSIKVEDIDKALEKLSLIN